MLDSKHTQAPSPTNKRARVIESYKEREKKTKDKNKRQPSKLEE
jgi:hypothetical protein